MKKDLFDVLREKAHCEFISDLLYVDYDLIRVHLEHIDYNEFELSELLDAVNWFGNVKLETDSKKEVFDYLLTLDREKAKA